MTGGIIMKCWNARGYSFVSSTINCSSSLNSILLTIYPRTQITLARFLLLLLRLAKTWYNLNMVWFCCWMSAAILLFVHPRGLYTTSAHIEIKKWILTILYRLSRNLTMSGRNGENEKWSSEICCGLWQTQWSNSHSHYREWKISCDIIGCFFSKIDLAFSNSCRQT